MPVTSRETAEPPSSGPSSGRSGQLRAAASIEASNSRHPARSPTRSQGRRKPVPGGSGRGVPAADGLANEPGTDRAAARSERSVDANAKASGVDRGRRRTEGIKRGQATRLRVEVQYAQRPDGVPGPVALRRWARLAYVAAGGEATPARATKTGVAKPVRTLTVRVAGRAESQRLNRGFRGKDKPTNVLSFPASPEERALDGALGDLVICAPVVAREAREQRKALTAHWAHMVVHGTLHLLGHDHERPRQARVMEGLEVEILRGFGFDDPYLRVTHGRYE